MTSTQKKLERKIIIGIMLLFLLSQYSLMYSYGNALKSQNEYQKYLVYNIAHDVETINSDGDYNTLSFYGVAPQSRQVQMICSKTPIMKEMVPTYFTNSTWIGGVWLYHYLQYGIVIEDITSDDVLCIEDQLPLFKNSIYSCYCNGDKILIVFK